MATIEIRNDNSVIVRRESEHCFNNEFENVIRPIKGDKTFIIAELLVPQIWIQNNTLDATTRGAQMTLPEAIQILKTHNEWRRGVSLEFVMVDPTELGIAIDLIVKDFERRVGNDEISSGSPPPPPSPPKPRYVNEDKKPEKREK